MHDLGRLYRDFGPSFIKTLLPWYGRPCSEADRERIAFYARCALVEDIAFGLHTGAAAYADAALANLARTFA